MPRARSRSRSRSVTSQASKFGSTPSRSSSRSPSSSASEAGCGRCGPHHLLDVDPDGARPQGQVIAGDDQDVGFRRRQRIQQAMDFLPQRRPRLFFRPTAPELLRQPAAQHRPGRRHRDAGQQRAGLAPSRQDVFAADGPGFHLANQPQAARQRDQARPADDEGPGSRVVESAIIPSEP